MRDGQSSFLPKAGAGRANPCPRVPPVYCIVFMIAQGSSGGIRNRGFSLAWSRTSMPRPSRASAAVIGSLDMPHPISGAIGVRGNGHLHCQGGEDAEEA